MKLSELVKSLSPVLNFNDNDVLKFIFETETEEDKYKIWLKDGRRFLISFSPFRPSPWIIIDASGWWVGKSGRVRVQDMSDSHYWNTIRFLIKNLRQEPNNWKLKWNLASLKRDSRFTSQISENEDEDESRFD